MFLRWIVSSRTHSDPKENHTKIPVYVRHPCSLSFHHFYISLFIFKLSFSSSIPSFWKLFPSGNLTSRHPTTPLSKIICFCHQSVEQWSGTEQHDNIVDTTKPNYISLTAIHHLTTWQYHGLLVGVSTLSWWGGLSTPVTPRAIPAVA